MSERTTPTPWPDPEYDNSCYSDSHWWNIEGVAKYIHREADAALICRTVNAHAEMVEALKAVDKALSIGWTDLSQVHGVVRSALAKATGEEG